jgi:potassium-transporting ATPase KdpC subunit
MLTDIRRAVTMLAVMTLITGVAYPLLVTAISQAAFHGKATGSLIERDGKPVGSMLIGQPFGDPKHFWSRPSATAPYPYNAASSGGSNLGPHNPSLADVVSARIKALHIADPDNPAAVPVDLVTASASGLDPHISPAAAEYQVNRVARARNLDPEKVRTLVAQFTEGRQLGFLGEPRVNVLRLNLALDAVKP